MLLRHLWLAGLVAAVPATAQDDPRRALFSSNDYPAEAIKRGEEGVVRARLRITAQGRVSACTITQSASPALDAATCQLFVKRALFRPSTAPDGKAIESDYDTPPIRWTLPTKVKPPQQGLRL